MTEHSGAAARAGGICAYICVRRASEAIEFYRKAFAAEELFRLVDPSSGKIGHAELRVGSDVLMISDE